MSCCSLCYLLLIVVAVATSGGFASSVPVASSWTGSVVAPAPTVVHHVSGEPAGPTLTQWSTPVNYRPTPPQYVFYYSQPVYGNPIGDLIDAKLNFKHAVLGAIVRYIHKLYYIHYVKLNK
jgi:hypothetical protein